MASPLETRQEILNAREKRINEIHLEYDKYIHAILKSKTVAIVQCIDEYNHKLNEIDNKSKQQNANIIMSSSPPPLPLQLQPPPPPPLTNYMNLAVPAILSSKMNTKKRNILQTIELNTPSPSPKKRKLNKDIIHIRFCGICWNDHDTEANNRLISCNGCKIYVHQRCIGTNKTINDIFYCVICSYHLKQNNNSIPDDMQFIISSCKCNICKLKDNSNNLGGKLSWTLQNKMNPNISPKWCHLICGIYISETSLDSNKYVNNVNGINKLRYENKCVYCAKTKGAKLFCSVIGCKKRFHASCALINGCSLQDIAINDKYNRVVYCEDHLSFILNNKNITINENQNNLIDQNIAIGNKTPNYKSKKKRNILTIEREHIRSAKPLFSDDDDYLNDDSNKSKSPFEMDLSEL